MDRRDHVSFDSDDGSDILSHEGSSSSNVNGDHSEEDVFEVGPLNIEQLIANDEEQGRIVQVVACEGGGGGGGDTAAANDNSSPSNDDSIVISSGGVEDYMSGGRTTTASTSTRTSTQSTLSTMMMSTSTSSSANCSNNNLFDMSVSSLCSPTVEGGSNFAAISPSRRLRRTSLFVDHSSNRSLRYSQQQRQQRHSSNDDGGGGSSSYHALNNNSSYQSLDGHCSSVGNYSSPTSAAQQQQDQNQNQDYYNNIPFHTRDELSFDDNLLRSVLENCGQWATGVVYVQLWVMNEQRNRLVRPDAGWWLDPIYHDCNNCSNSSSNNRSKRTDEDEEKQEGETNEEDNNGQNTGIFGGRKRKSNNPMCHLCRLEDKNHPHYVSTEPLPIGVGLAGALWASLQRNTEHLIWRDIAQMANDPDEPWDPRLQLLVQCQFGYATAVPFNVLGEEGIIVCMTRPKSQLNINQLTSPTNETYLISCAQLIGSAFVFRSPRRDAVAERRANLDAALRRARNRILALRALGVNLSDLATGSQPTNSTSTSNVSSSSSSSSKPPFGRIRPTNILKNKKQQQSSNHVGDSQNNVLSSSACCCRGLTSTCRLGCIGHDPSSFNVGGGSTVTQCGYVRRLIDDAIEKMKGAGVKPAPPFDYVQSLWTFMGCFITLLVLTNFNRYLLLNHGVDHTFILPPCGAFMMLLYGLSPAPSAQPRNAMIGQAMSMTIGMAISYMKFIPLWLRQSLGTSLAITAMVKNGILHPPAGATAMVFSNGEGNAAWGWSNAGFMLVATALSIVFATLINNLSTQRQYPNYWGMRGPTDFVMKQVNNFVSVFNNIRMTTKCCFNSSLDRSHQRHKQTKRNDDTKIKQKEPSPIG